MSAMLQYINQLGPSVVLPVIIFVLGLVLGLSAGRAFRAGVLIGVGFIGINLVIGLLGNSIGPAARQMVEHTGVQLTYLDVGWPSTAAIAFGASVGALAIPVGLVVNIGMLLLRLTKTLDIDLWNYWHIAFAGGIVAILTGNFALGVLGEVIAMVLILVLADWSQPWVRRYFGYDTISFPHGTSTPYFVIALGLEWIFERIPGFRQWDASPEALQRRFGVFGASMVLGALRADAARWRSPGACPRRPAAGAARARTTLPGRHHRRPALDPDPDARHVRRGGDDHSTAHGRHSHGGPVAGRRCGYHLPAEALPRP